MGWLYPQFVIGQIYEGHKELDDLCKESDGMIIRMDGKANGEVNYFMGWDGSKEGWETSDQYDKLREKFLNTLKKVNASWYKIDDDYEHGDYVHFTSYLT